MEGEITVPEENHWTLARELTDIGSFVPSRQWKVLDPYGLTLDQVRIYPEGIYSYWKKNKPVIYILIIFLGYKEE